MSGQPKKNIVIVGGGYAGIGLVHQIEKILPSTHRIVLIEEQDFMYAKLGAARASTSEDIAERILIPYNRLFKSNATGIVVQASVTGIRPDSVTVFPPHAKFGSDIGFDYLIIAVGSSWHDPVSLHTKSRREAIALLAKRRAEAAAAKSIIIVGAGPVGLELSGEIKMLNPKIEVTIVQAGRLPLTDHYPAHFRKKVVDALKQRGIQIILNEKADISSINGAGRVQLQSGQTLSADLVFVATGSTPRGELIKTLSHDLYNPVTHSIRVKGTLQVADDKYPKIFVAGDVADTGDVKMSYKAGLHAPIVAKNIKTLLKGEAPKAIYTPSTAEMVCIPLGKDGGVTYLSFFGGLTLGNYLTKQMKGKDLFVTKQGQLVQRY